MEECSIEKVKGQEISYRYRALLKRMLTTLPEVKKVELDTDPEHEAELCFYVLMDDLNVDNETFLKYQKEIFSNYIVDTIGELIVRENLEKFAPFLTKLTTERYIPMVNRWDHKRFGLKVAGSFFIFRFYIGHLQSILIEDFKHLS